jgi:hypothetical protein
VWVDALTDASREIHNPARLELFPYRDRKPPGGASGSGTG